MTSGDVEDLPQSCEPSSSGIAPMTSKGERELYIGKGKQKERGILNALIEMIVEISSRVSLESPVLICMIIQEGGKSQSLALGILLSKEKRKQEHVNVSKNDKKHFQQPCE